MKAISFLVVLKIASAFKHICISIHIFPGLLNVTASSTESVTTCICRQDCVAAFQEEQWWAHLYHISQWELDVLLPADGMFSQSREQTPEHHFRSSISAWSIRIRASQETPLGSHTHLRRKVSCVVLSKTTAVFCWGLLMPLQSGAGNWIQCTCVVCLTSSPSLGKLPKFGRVVNVYI